MRKLPILQALGMLLIAAYGSGATAQQSRLPAEPSERPPEVARMIRLSDEVSNARSRSAAERDERTHRACGRRDALTATLNESGWCDGRVDEASARVPLAFVAPSQPCLRVRHEFATQPMVLVDQSYDACVGQHAGSDRHHLLPRSRPGHPTGD